MSCTVTFDPATEADQLKPALELFQYQLKGVSFLPRTESGAYAQMPYVQRVVTLARVGTKRCHTRRGVSADMRRLHSSSIVRW